MPRRHLASHFAVALLAAAAGWLGGAMKHDSPQAPVSGTTAGAAFHAPLADRPGGPDAPRRAASRASDRGKQVKGKATGAAAGTAPMTFLPDGSVNVPREMIERIRINPFDSDIALDRKELGLFGFSPKECDELQGVIDNAFGKIAAGEAERAVVLSRSDTETIIKIPPASGTNEVVRQMEERVRAIAKDRAELILPALGGQKDWAKEGQNLRIVRRTVVDELNFNHELIIIREDAGSELAPDAGLEEYRGHSRMSQTWMNGRSNPRLKHLFPE